MWKKNIILDNFDGFFSLIHEIKQKISKLIYGEEKMHVKYKSAYH